MRRSSLVGPILLILIGSLFLVHNVRPELPILSLLADYWPFLLIAWGAIRLIEILFLAVRSRPLPVAGLSGGEWTLIVFICLIGSAASVGKRYSAHWPQVRIRGIEVFGESFDYPLAAQKEAGKTPRILIENLRGNTRIAGADTTEVKVTGRTTVRALDRADADKASRECPLEIVTVGDQIVVRTNQDRLSTSQRVSADLEITVPRGASVQGRGRQGDFDISDLTGNVDINSENAGVRLHNLGGNLRAELRRSDIVRAIQVKGSVDLKGRGHDVELADVAGQVTVEGSYSGELLFRNLARPLQFQSSQTELRVEKVPGQVRIALGELTANDVAGPIRLQTKSKDVELTNFSEALEVSVERGDIELRPARLPLARIDVRARSGDVELAIPGSAKFQLKGTTTHGEVNNDFGDPLRTESEGRGATISGSSGPGPNISVVTNRGSITIRKAGEEPSSKTSAPTSLKVEHP